MNTTPIDQAKARWYDAIEKRDEAHFHGDRDREAWWRYEADRRRREVEELVRPR